MTSAHADACQRLSIVADAVGNVAAEFTDQPQLRGSRDRLISALEHVAWPFVLSRSWNVTGNAAVLRSMEKDGLLSSSGGRRWLVSPAACTTKHLGLWLKDHGRKALNLSSEGCGELMTQSKFVSSLWNPTVVLNPQAHLHPGALRVRLSWHERNESDCLTILALGYGLAYFFGRDGVPGRMAHALLVRGFGSKGYMSRLKEPLVPLDDEIREIRRVTRSKQRD